MQDHPCNQPSETPTATLPSGGEQAVVEMLLEKEVTRSTTYYKVYIHLWMVALLRND